MFLALIKLLILLCLIWLSLHTHRRFDFAQRSVVPIICFRLLSGAEISDVYIIIQNCPPIIIENCLINYHKNTIIIIK